MRIALTGASGILGEALAEHAIAKGYKIVPVPREQLIRGCIGMVVSNVDAVIHAAANTNVEACELDPSSCYRDNLLLSERVAEVCQREGRKLVFISSTGVYGMHHAQPYAEYDIVEPTTHHHRAKHMAEQAVLAFSQRNLVLRTGWLFGGSPLKPKNFVARRLEEAAEALKAGRLEMPANPLQYGSPSFTRDVAYRLFDALDRDESGVFNVVNSGHASRLEYVQAILEAAGLNLRAVSITRDEVFRRVAQVSPNESAVNWRFDMLGYTPMPFWKDSLSKYVASLDWRG